MEKGAFLEYIGKEAQTNRHKQTKNDFWNEYGKRRVLEYIRKEARTNRHKNNKMMSNIFGVKIYQLILSPKHARIRSKSEAEYQCPPPEDIVFDLSKVWQQRFFSFLP
jgi:hypothetical protein